MNINHQSIIMFIIKRMKAPIKSCTPASGALVQLPVAEYH